WLCAALKSTAVIGIDCKTSEGGIIDQGRQLNGEASVRYRDVFNKLVISAVMTGNVEQIKIGQDALPFYTEIKNPSARCIVIQLSEMQLNTVSRISHRNFIAIATVTFGLIQRIFACTADSVADDLRRAPRSKTIRLIHHTVQGGCYRVSGVNGVH